MLEPLGMFNLHKDLSRNINFIWRKAGYGDYSSTLLSPYPRYYDKNYINVLTNLFLSFWLHVKCLGWREEQNEILIILSNLIMQTDGKFA